MKKLQAAFTLVELLTVIMVIAVLAGLVLSTAGYVQKKAATSRASAEIAALSAACESYKADNGIYPRDTATTDNLNPKTTGDPNSYKASSLFLYKQLSGDLNNDAGRAPDTGYVVYFEFAPKMLAPTVAAGSSSTAVTFMQDPFGYSYGYSTSTNAYNPTFDLWSTAGNTKAPTPTNPSTDVTVKWIKNW